MYKLIIYSIAFSVLFSCTSNSKRIEKSEVENFMFSFFSTREKLILIASEEERAIINQVKEFYAIADSASILIDNLLSYKRNNENGVAKIFYHESNIISAAIDNNTFVADNHSAKFNISVVYKQRVNEKNYLTDDDVYSEGRRVYQVKIIQQNDGTYKIQSARLILDPIANNY